MIQVCSNKSVQWWGDRTFLPRHTDRIRKPHMQINSSNGRLKRQNGEKWHWKSGGKYEIGGRKDIGDRLVAFAAVDLFLINSFNQWKRMTKIYSQVWLEWKQISINKYKDTNKINIIQNGV